MDRRLSVEHPVGYNSVSMTNINGKAYALTAITPMKPWKTPIVLLLFLLLRLFPSRLVYLKNLSFIHFARWVVVKRHQFPHVAPDQEREQLAYDYLLFFSNFNGTWNQYIDAFSTCLALGLDQIWIWSEKYPRAVPVSDFKRYITSVQFDTDFYYTAYPGAATNDVKAAIAAESALTGFADSSRGMTPDQFAGAWRRFLVEVQGNLGATGPGPRGS
jgi:hypothetical protein